jgi:hypothetical protein
MPTPENLWQRLVDEAGDDAVESAAAVSVGQAQRDLVAAGFDVKAERARAEARIAELTGEPAPASRTPEPAVEPTAWVRGAIAPARRSFASRKAVWLVAALAAMATAGGIFYAAAHRPKPPDKPVEAPSATAPAPAPPSPVAPSGPLPRGEKPGDPKPGLVPTH